MVLYHTFGWLPKVYFWGTNGTEDGRPHPQRLFPQTGARFRKTEYLRLPDFAKGEKKEKQTRFAQTVLLFLFNAKFGGLRYSKFSCKCAPAWGKSHCGRNRPSSVPDFIKVFSTRFVLRLGRCGPFGCLENVCR